MGLGYIMMGLFVTCMFVIFDTQLIIEQSERGIRPVAGHAMELFMNLFRLFMKILQVLQELQNEDKRKRKK